VVHELGNTTKVVTNRREVNKEVIKSFPSPSVGRERAGGGLKVGVWGYKVLKTKPAITLREGKRIADC